MASRRSNAVVSDKARRAVSEFRKIQPTLTAFARVLTTNQKVRIIASTGVPRTDGRDIFIQPPIELGGQHQHDRAVCDRRNWTTMQQECPACAVREEVMATTYHEISHIAFESFAPPSASQLKEALAFVRQVSSPKQAERIIRRITESAEIPKSYMALASVINPYFKLLANSLEDVRINARMHKARPGTKPMMDAQILRVMSEGVAKHDGTVALWTDMHLNHQASIGAYLLASGFEPEPGWLADEVVAALKDEQLRDILVLIPETEDAHEAFTKSWAVFMRLRELGFYQLKEEEQDDEPEPEPEPEQQKPPTPPTPPQPQQDPEEQDDSDDEASSDGGSSAGDSSDMESDDDSDDAEDEESESPESDDDSESSADEDEPSSENGDGSSSEESDDASDEDESGDDEAEGSSGDEPEESEDGDASNTDTDVTESDEAGEDEDTQSDGDVEGEPESDEAGEAEAGDGGDDDANDGADANRDEEDGSGDSDDGGDSEDESGDSGESGEPSEAGDGPAFLVEPDEEAEDEDIDLGDLGLHQHHEETTPQDEKAIEVAIVQDEYFEKPSTTINGVKEWWYETRETDAINRSFHAWDGRQLDARTRRILNGDFDLPTEQVMGPALMKMRLVFAENKRTHRNRNQRSGRLQTRALGKRAPFGDDRLFGKKVVPAKRDYIVLIFLDVSGSTMMGGGGKPNIQLIKEAAMGQAELCARTGVPFEILAHTGAPATDGEVTSFDATDKNLWLDIYHIKDVDQPWDDKAKQRLMDIGPSYYNLDGHTLEYARRRVESIQATDRVILYYSDGKMPLENYYEELEILQREIATCKQKNITLLGVGIRTDSPAQHGLDTVEVGDSSDIGRVVAHLERRLVS